ncbi:MAG: HD domain-containing protein, partial [Kiritimatiellaeota bacterium]|nr:HD domain-containing protein [Kiritimatiellota bacterium]
MKFDCHTAAMSAARLIREAGGRAFFVGGCVRDSLLGLRPKDFDIEAYGLAPNALRAALEREFRIDAVGENFCVFKLAHHEIDVSLPRTENKTGAGHRGFAVGADPQLPFDEAASRRDFTINAILQDALTGEIIDPFGGERDLRRGVLRHVGPKFTEDPLRVLRAMQFAARFKFEVAPETVALCATMTQEDLPRERLAAEWEKLLLQGKRPSLGLEFLRACGWLRFYPELIPLIGCEQYAKWHPEGDVWTHTLHALDALPLVLDPDAPQSDNLLVAVSALCHDFGKPLVSRREDDGRITAHGHEHAADSLVRSFTERLWNLRGFADEVVKFVNAHMRPLSLVFQGASDKAYRRLAAEIGRLDLLAKIAECDTRASPPNPPNLEMIAEFKRRAAALFVLQAPPAPIIQGRHLI